MGRSECVGMCYQCFHSPIYQVIFSNILKAYNVVDILKKMKERGLCVMTCLRFVEGVCFMTR